MIDYRSCVLTFAVVATPAMAYIDPGSGHLLWQLLASLLVGGAFTFRRVLRWRPGKRKQNEARPAVENETSAKRRDSA